MRKKSSVKISLSDIAAPKGISPVNKFLVFVLCGLTFFALVFAVISFFNSNASSDELSNQNNLERVSRSLSGKTVEQDRMDAVNAAVELFELTNAPETKDKAEAEFLKMEQGDFSIIDPEFLSKVRLYDELKNNVEFQQELTISVFSMGTVIKESNGGKIASNLDKLGTVRVDQETGVAQVPLELFTGGESPVALTMIYVNDKWLLEPYSFSSYIKLSVMAQNG